MIKASEQEEGKGVNLHVVETKWEVKFLIKLSWHLWREKGEVGVQTKRHMTFFREKIELRPLTIYITLHVK